MIQNMCTILGFREHFANFPNNFNFGEGKLLQNHEKLNHSINKQQGCGII